MLRVQHPYGTRAAAPMVNGAGFRVVKVWAGCAAGVFQEERCADRSHPMLACCLRPIGLQCVESGFFKVVNWLTNSHLEHKTGDQLVG